MNVFQLFFINFVISNIIKYLFFLFILYDLLFMCIYKVSFIVGIVHMICVVVWVNKVE